MFSAHTIFHGIEKNNKMTPSLIVAAAGSALHSVQHVQGAAFLVGRFQETESLGLRPEALLAYPVRALNFHKFSVEVGRACCVKSCVLLR